jgi:transcriptional regulator with XRE-family HTH domain
MIPLVAVNDVQNDVQVVIAELESKGWTLAAIATEINVTVNAVEKWKAGDRHPANSKAVMMILQSLTTKKRIPKKKRYSLDTKEES